MIDEISPKVKDVFERLCEEKNITGKEKKKKWKEVKKVIKRSQYEPGEAVGVIAAQSISEPATQMTMRSYTLASQSDRLSKVTQGLPRLIEIFDARKTFERSMKIYLEDDCNNKEDAMKIAREIRNRNIEDILVDSKIDLVDRKIELNFENKTQRDKARKKIDKYVKKTDTYVRRTKVLIKPEDDSIENMRDILESVSNYHFEGIKKIEQVVVVKDEDDWIIQTNGANLKQVLQHDGVDISRTKCNDMHQVLKVLGIEATRNLIIEEAKKTLEDQGLEVDTRHLILLADMMTNDGEVKAIGRYGVSGEKGSVLARANFEETKKHLVNAAFGGEKDKLKSTIENIIIGQVAPIGTGLVDLGIDVEKMKKIRGRK